MKLLNVVRYKIFILAFLFLTGCGSLEKGCEDANYETITNEEGNITLVSGGVEYAHYDYVDIVYSNSDSQSVLFRTKEGQKIFWQGDMKFEIK